MGIAPSLEEVPEFELSPSLLTVVVMVATPSFSMTKVNDVVSDYKSVCSVWANYFRDDVVIAKVYQDQGLLHISTGVRELTFHTIAVGGIVSSVTVGYDSVTTMDWVVVAYGPAVKMNGAPDTMLSGPPI